MKILVPVKRVVDPNVRVRIDRGGLGVDLSNVKMAMNPFDEISLEAALRLKEAGVGSEVVAVSIGPVRAEETLRTALAMGADRAILIETELSPEPLAVAKLLKAIAVEEQPELIIVGKQAVDDDCNQTGQMLAALLGWPQATFCSHIEVRGRTATVRREVDRGTQVVEVTLPAVMTTDLRLNEPRYPSLPNIMKAKSKPLSKRAAADFGVSLIPRLTVLRAEEPERRASGVRVASVAALLIELRARSLIS